MAAISLAPSDRTDAAPPAGPGRWAAAFARPDGLDRASLLAFSLLVLVLSGARRALTGGDAGPLPIEIGGGECIAAAALLKVLLTPGGEPIRLRPADLGLLVLSSLFWLVGHPFVPFLSFTVAGLWFGWRYRHHADLLALSRVWLAASAYEVWGRSVFKLTSSFVIEGEVAVLAAVGRLVIPGLEQDGIRLGRSADWFVYILEGCSSFHNMSLALLVWVSLATILSARFTGRVWAALAAALAGTFVLNVVRILLMVDSRDGYLFWHEGSGASVFATLTLLAAALPTALACLSAPKESSR